MYQNYLYTVMQSDRNSSKTDTFHKPITYKRHVQTNNEQKTTFARHEYGRVGVFRIKISSLLPKLQPLEKCQFSNCSHLIASHCTFKFSRFFPAFNSRTEGMKVFIKISNYKFPLARKCMFFLQQGRYT